MLLFCVVIHSCSTYSSSTYLEMHRWLNKVGCFENLPGNRRNTQITYKTFWLAKLDKHGLYHRQDSWLQATDSGWLRQEKNVPKGCWRARRMTRRKDHKADKRGRHKGSRSSCNTGSVTDRASPGHCCTSAELGKCEHCLTHHQIPPALDPACHCLYTLQLLKLRCGRHLRGGVSVVCWH